MTEKEFKELCDVCDSLLVANDTSVTRIANSWLHIIREHPVFLKNYEGLFRPSLPSVTIKNKLLQKVRKVASGIKLLSSTRTLREKSIFNICSDLEKTDVLFISHLINESQIGSSTDFYFGNLPRELAAKGYTVTVALIDHTNISQLLNSACWAVDNVRRVLLPRVAGVLDEIEFKKAFRVESKRLRKLAEFATSRLEKKVFLCAADQATSNSNSANLRIGRLVGELNAMLQPKLMVVTYEGHAWERLAFSFARAVNPRVLCAGYQHAALFKLQHAIRRKLARQYNPDIILTSGHVAKRQMEQSEVASGVPIVVLGSNRVSQKIEVQNPLSQAITCLVLPEGIESECNLLLEFSLGCANVMPNVKFLWRMHPLMNFDLLSGKNPKLQNLPGNVSLSKTTLSDDASKAQFALYRGTTAIVSMVMSGIRPIYLKTPGEMTIDPLYELEQWKAVVSTVAEFRRLIETSKSSNQDEAFERACAQEYSKEFYSPIDVIVLERVLQDIEK